MGATHELQVLGWLFIQVVCQFLVKAGQVLHLHLDPVFTQVVMPFEFIPLVVNRGAGGQGGRKGALRNRQQQFTCTPASVPPGMIHRHCPTCT